MYGPAARLHVPVENAADEGRDQEDAGLGAGHGLGSAEQQREVAVDALVLEHLGGADAFPGRGDLDQDALAADAALLVGGDDRAGLGDRRLGVEGEVGIDLGRDPARHDARRARCRRRPRAGRRPPRHRLRAPPCPRPQASASSTMAPESAGFSTAFSSRVGLVVQSCGFRRRTASMSPVSATTTVMARNWSSFEGIESSVRLAFVSLSRRRAPREVRQKQRRRIADGMKKRARAWPCTRPRMKRLDLVDAPRERDRRCGSRANRCA